jgi:transposase-like protein
MPKAADTANAGSLTMARPIGLEAGASVRTHEIPELSRPGQSRQLREALAIFADELSAHRYLERLLWPDGVDCPRCCSSAKVGKLNGKSTHLGIYKCYSCRKTFSVLHGTFMSASHVPAHKWLQAMYLTAGGAKPMRAHHLSRILNVSFKTAASMVRRIGEAADNLRPASTDRRGQPAPTGLRPHDGPVPRVSPGRRQRILTGRATTSGASPASSA